MPPAAIHRSRYFSQSSIRISRGFAFSHFSFDRQQITSTCSPMCLAIQACLLAAASGNVANKALLAPRWRLGFDLIDAGHGQFYLHERAGAYEQ